MWFWIFVAALLLLVLYFVAIYNSLVSLRERAKAAWSDIDVQLQRRHNLIPALVDVVKGYAKYESSTLQKVIKARNSCERATTPAQKADAEKALTASLSKLFALAEAYPDLKANQNYLQLQQQLAQIEDAIQNARRYYNAVVRDYNAKIESFPDMLIAKRYGFTPMEFFELEDESIKAMPKIDL